MVSSFISGNIKKIETLCRLVLAVCGFTFNYLADELSLPWGKSSLKVGGRRSIRLESC